MNSASEPLWHDVTIVNELGLHARAAAKLAKLAGTATGHIHLEAHAERADATQVIDILMLGAAVGDTVRVVIDNDADHPVLEQIVALFADGFGEM